MLARVEGNEEQIFGSDGPVECSDTEPVPSGTQPPGQLGQRTRRTAAAGRPDVAASGIPSESRKAATTLTPVAEVNVDGLRLSPLGDNHEHEARAASSELEREGFPFLLGMEASMPWDDYVALTEANRCGRRLPDGHVPSTFLGAFIDGTLVGRTSIRHELNAFLEREGGHIGFAVRPAVRRQGIATAILRQSLVIARALGVEEILVTCDDNNVPSAAAIERCGGALENVVEPAEGTAPVRRYWIR